MTASSSSTKPRASCCSTAAPSACSATGPTRSSASRCRCCFRRRSPTATRPMSPSLARVCRAPAAWASARASGPCEPTAAHSSPRPRSRTSTSTACATTQRSCATCPSGSASRRRSRQAKRASGRSPKARRWASSTPTAKASACTSIRAGPTWLACVRARRSGRGGRARCTRRTAPASTPRGRRRSRPARRSGTNSGSCGPMAARPGSWATSFRSS